MKRIAVLVSLLSIGCHANNSTKVASTAPPLSKTQRMIVESARDQLSWHAGYDAAYCRIAYPNGDVPRTKGACTDVVIRSLRHSGYDLQKLIHDDMVKSPGSYPHYPGRHPDTNIDHRRVPNQRVFFRRHAGVLTLKTNDPKAWQAGDIVEWKLLFGHDHTGVLSDKRDPDGFPYVIHNIGHGPQEEDVLRSWTIAGHFRFPKPQGVSNGAAVR